MYTNIMYVCIYVCVGMYICLMRASYCMISNLVATYGLCLYKYPQTILLLLKLEHFQVVYFGTKIQLCLKSIYKAIAMLKLRLR